jgi:hypothetical protein
VPVANGGEAAAGDVWGRRSSWLCDGGGARREPGGEAEGERVRLRNLRRRRRRSNRAQAAEQSSARSEGGSYLGEKTEEAAAGPMEDSKFIFCDRKGSRIELPLGPSLRATSIRRFT